MTTHHHLRHIKHDLLNMLGNLHDLKRDTDTNELTDLRRFLKSAYSEIHNALQETRRLEKVAEFDKEFDK